MADVREIVGKLLEGADDDSLTERILRNALQKELGRDLTEEELQTLQEAIEVHCSQPLAPKQDEPLAPNLEELKHTASRAVGGTVDAAETAAATAEPGISAKAGEPAAELGGQKRKAVSPPAQEVAAAKKPAPIPATAGATNLNLSDYKRVDVRKFHGKVLIDIREHYKDKASGELKPSKKGLALSAEQWDTLSKALPELSDAFKVHDIPEPADIITPASVPKGSSMLTSRDTSFELKLSNNRKVTISEFKGVVRVDIREYYEAEGVQKPSAKGSALDASAWAALISNKENIDAAIAAV